VRKHRKYTHQKQRNNKERTKTNHLPNAEQKQYKETNQCMPHLCPFNTIRSKQTKQVDARHNAHHKFAYTQTN
jgi:hypothetical protein